LHSNINYRKLFDAYKEMVLKQMHDGTLQSHQIMAVFKHGIFGDATFSEEVDGDADSSKLDLGMENLSLGDADDHFNNDLDHSAQEGMLECLSSVSQTRGAAPSPTTLSAQYTILSQKPPPLVHPLSAEVSPE
jgi:hypothetical protein